MSTRVSCNVHPVQMDYEKKRRRERERERTRCTRMDIQVSLQCNVASRGKSVHTRQKESRVEQDASVAANATCPLHK